jgi:catechol 2,3-dioxygenase-like lactoylglutathione lyase family enzyme
LLNNKPIVPQDLPRRVIAMILGLSHIAMTVGSADASIEHYSKQLGFQIESDAERKGPAVEAVTGIKGFHTRTVYLSVTDRQHLEVFEFHYPPASARPQTKIIEPGILYAVLSGFPLPETRTAARIFTDEDPEFDLWRGWDYKAATHDSHHVTIRDPDGMALELRAIPDDEEGKRRLPCSFLHAVVVSQDWSTSIGFYESMLGLQQSRTVSNGLRSALLTGSRGICLEILHRSDLILPRPRSWRMEQVGFTHLAFAVADLPRYHQDLLKKGVRFRSDPQDIRIGPHTGGRNVYVDAPDGIVVELIESPLVDKQWATTSRVESTHKRASPSKGGRRYPTEETSG